MKYILLIIGWIAIGALCIITFLRNVPRFAYNLFHKTRRPYFHPIDMVTPDLDVTENYYHD